MGRRGEDWLPGWGPSLQELMSSELARQRGSGSNGMKAFRTPQGIPQGESEGTPGVPCGESEGTPGVQCGEAVQQAEGHHLERTKGADVGELGEFWAMESLGLSNMV